MADYRLDTPMKAAIYISQAAGDKDVNNILPVKISRVSPSPRARVMSNTMANGTIYHDHKVIDPVEITVECVLERSSEKYDIAIQSIYTLWEVSAINPNAKEYTTENAPFSMVRTKDGVLWKNLVLSSCPHTEDAEHYDVFMFQLHFSEFRVVNSTGIKPLNNYVG